MNPEIKVDTIKEKIKDENIGSIVSVYYAMKFMSKL